MRFAKTHILLHVLVANARVELLQLYCIIGGRIVNNVDNLFAFIS